MTVTPTGISTDVRLPKHLNPDKYKIYLTPFIEEGNFTIPGHVDISLTVVEAQAANNVTLHIEKIDIYENTVKITKENEDEVGIEGFGYDKENHYFIIFLSETLQKGEKIDLSIDFLAELNADLSGFYRSKYFDEEKNQTEYIATTQFESIGARRALPCFDEPGFKSVFQVNLGRLKDMRTISNMPAEYEDVPMACGIFTKTRQSCQPTSWHSLSPDSPTGRARPCPMESSSGSGLGDLSWIKQNLLPRLGQASWSSLRGITMLSFLYPRWT